MWDVLHRPESGPLTHIASAVTESLCVIMTVVGAWSARNGLSTAGTYFASQVTHQPRIAAAAYCRGAVPPGARP